MGSAYSATKAQLEVVAAAREWRRRYTGRGLHCWAPSVGTRCATWPAPWMRWRNWDEQRTYLWHLRPSPPRPFPCTARPPCLSPQAADGPVPPLLAMAATLVVAATRLRCLDETGSCVATNFKFNHFSDARESREDFIMRMAAGFVKRWSTNRL